MNILLDYTNNNSYFVVPNLLMHEIEWHQFAVIYNLAALAKLIGEF